MQAEAAAAEVVGGRRRDSELNHQPGSHVGPPAPRHDWEAAEEENLHREQRPVLLGEGVLEEPETELGGGSDDQRPVVHGEGGGEGVVLQQAAEGEACLAELSGERPFSGDCDE